MRMRILSALPILLVAMSFIEVHAFSPYVDADGNISRPEIERANWEHLGSWYVPSDAGAAGPGFHDVYASPGTSEAFRQTGRFPDGAVLLKEVRAVENKPLTTGNAHWAGETGVWFVMIKDDKNRFPANPVWGEGWGWGLFTAAAPAVNVTGNWKQGDGLGNCHVCHLPAKTTDWVYTEGYPSLR